MKAANLVLIAVIAGMVSGALGAFMYVELRSPSQNELIEDFYLTENAVHVSPHSIRKSMASGVDNFVLVDLRSKQEYDTEHVVGAVNIPAYSDPDTSDYGAVERIVSSFETLKADNPGKDIIVYCYSMPCMTGRKIGKILAHEGIYVKHLGIGWNEWRYYWDLWNHELEWEKTDVKDYIASGSEPGVPNITGGATTCPVRGGLGC